jgi:hypothetical protein
MDSAGTGSVSSVTYTFDDAAADFLPFGSTPPTGTYKPSPYDSSGNISATPAFSLSSPAPAQPYGLFLSAFNGAAANGTWSLFVQDFLDFGSLGSIRSWSLEITTEAAVVPEPTTLSLVGLGLVALVMRHRCQ